MEASLHHVLFPAVPRADESLIGLVSRTAAENHHGSVSLILGEAGYRAHAHGCLATTRHELAGALSTVIRTPERDVTMRLQREIPTPYWVSRVDLLGAAVMPCDLDQSSRRVAPASLRRSGHHRALWAHRLVPYCTETGGALIDSCPNCGVRLGWQRANGISICDACEADLRDYDPPGPTDEVRREVDPVLDLLAPDPARHGPALDRLHPDLRSIGRGAAFELGWRIACALGAPAGVEKRTAQAGLDAAAHLATLQEAGRMLGSWPRGVGARLTAIGGIGDVSTLDRLVRRLRFDLRKRATWPEIATLAAKAMPDLLAWPRRARGVVIENSPTTMGATELARLFGVSSNKMTALHRADRLPKVIEGGGTRNCFATFDAGALAGTADAFRDRVRILLVAGMLGTTRNGVEQLLCIGAIDEIEDAAVRLVSPDAQISMRSVRELVSSISARARPIRADDVPLRVGLRSIGGREKPYGPLLMALATGGSSFAMTEDEAPLVDRILIERDAAGWLRSLDFGAAARPSHLFRADLTRLDAMDVLNLSAPCFMRALDDDLRSCMGDGILMRRDAVLAMAARRVSFMEVSHRFSGGRRSVPRMLRRGGPIPRLGVTGWDRPTVERVLEGSRGVAAALPEESDA